MSDGFHQRNAMLANSLTPVRFLKEKVRLSQQRKKESGRVCKQN